MLRSLQGSLLTVAWAWLALAAASHAEDYWSYAHGGIDALAVGDSAYAVTLVQNLHRLDLAAQEAMRSAAAERPLTHIYALPHSAFKQLIGADEKVASMFVTTGGDNFVLIDTSQAGDNRYWEAYFGYAGSILVSNGSMRYPDWFRLGFEELFAATSVEGARVTLGGFLSERIDTLTSGKPLPVRTLLALHRGDPQLKVPAFADMYEAESWFLTHLILFEGEHYGEFAQYFTLLDAGRNPDDAFAASFKASYADLDAMLQKALRAGRIRTSVLEIPLGSETGAAQRMRAVDADARLAELAVNVSNLPAAAEWSHAALALEPDNESALRARARVEVGQAQYASALKSIERLSNNPSLSAAGHADRALVLHTIGRAMTEQKLALTADPAELARRAAADYEQAIALDPGNLRYWAGRANLIADQRDSEAAQTFFPRVVHVFFQHPRSPELAAALAQMCSATKDDRNAVRFSQAWRDNTITVAGRDAASAYLARVKAHEDQGTATN